MSTFGYETAFPAPSEINVRAEVIGGNGMTIREWYAGMALQGIVAHMENAQNIAALAFSVADAMLAEAKKEKP